MTQKTFNDLKVGDILYYVTYLGEYIHKVEKFPIERIDDIPVGKLFMMPDYRGVCVRTEDLDRITEPDLNNNYYFVNKEMVIDYLQCEIDSFSDHHKNIIYQL